MTTKQRLAQLEKQSVPGNVTMTRKELTDKELTDRINRVLLNPHLIPKKAYDRLLEILENCKQRQANHERKDTLTKT